jgi:hypothetical protein
MTTTEKTAYVNAVLALKAEPITMAAFPDAWTAGARNRYDVYVWIHMLVMAGAHGGPAFSPWHREFLRQFELDLQRISGNPKLTIPYWDWVTVKQDTDAGWPFTNDFMGGMGTGADNRVETGQFAESAGLWAVNVRTGATSGTARDNTTYLRRETGQDPTDLPTLALLQRSLNRINYDAAPIIEDPSFTGLTNAQIIAQLDASFRKSLEYFLHNGPHGWVGGNMMPMTSPNDPIFFLHHCNIDRIWAIWQQRNAVGLTNYQPASGTANHSLNSTMLMLTQAFYNFPVLTTPSQLLNHKALGFMYDSDLPIISLVTPTVVFGEMPENTTTYLPIQFNIETCRKIKFRFTAIGGNTAFQVPDFTTPYEAVVLDNEGQLQTGEVFIKLNATTGLGSISGMATIDAFIEDSEGYYAAAPGDFRVGTWNVNFSADIQERQKSAICFVLDKSGSMDATDGTSIKRFEMLENAIAAARDILRDDDGAGMVYYDTNENRLFDITQLAGGGRTNIDNALSNPALIPDGWTAVGKGMIAGADVLGDEMGRAGTPYTNFAMIVLTDGNENITPYVSSPSVNGAITGLTNDIYAIGLGLQGSVSDAVLSSISRYMLITGEMQADERLFRLTKYFVQILADISKNDIVIDPSGRLIIGLPHEVEYELTEADIYADVIILSPFAPFISASLLAPNGDVISGTFGNVSHKVNLGNQIYRLTLPAIPGKEKETHFGTWKVVLKINPDAIKKNWNKYAEKYKDLVSKMFKYQSIPYSVIVQTFTDLNFNLKVEKTSNVAGAEINMYATLKQYNLPINGKVYAELLSPNGRRSLIELQQTNKGYFEGKFKSTISGIYSIRFKANGISMSGQRFTREALRTISLYKENPITLTDDSTKDDAKICEIIECFLSEKGIQEYLKKNNIDPDNITKCLKYHCMEPTKKPSKSSKNISDLSNVELKIVNKLQLFISSQKDAEIITTAPKMEKVDFPVAEIPMHDKEHLTMPVSPGLRLNKKGELEIIQFKHKHEDDTTKHIHNKKKS